MFVSIIVPAYSQEKTIKSDIGNIYKVMKSTRYDFEIIVVIDGYVDKTSQEAAKLKRSNIKVVGYKHNKGKGYAVKYGMARAKGDIIAFIDSGMEINANGISMILEHMQWYNAHIVVGSKRHPASKTNFPPLRRFYSFSYQILVYILFWLKVRDTQVGLKVFKREVLKAVLPKLVVKRYAFDIELLAVANYLGFSRIYEAPVEIEWDASSGSRFGKFLFLDPFIRGMLIDTLGVFYRMRVLKFYDSKKKRKKDNI